MNTEWLGWRTGVTITVDLGSEQDLSYFGIGALNETYSWIHLPKALEIATSNDGKTYSSLVVLENWTAENGRTEIGTSMNKKARYVRFSVSTPAPFRKAFPVQETRRGCSSTRSISIEHDLCTAMDLHLNS